MNKAFIYKVTDLRSELFSDNSPKISVTGKVQ